MIYEHIIAPAVLAEIAKNRRNCNDFTKQFTLPSPRVISDFPKFKTFRRMVYRALPSDESEITKTRLDELLGFIMEAHRVERCGSFSGERSWSENALSTSENCFVDFALVEQAELNAFSGEVINLRDIEDGLDDLSGQVIVEKEIDKMVKALGNLLRLSRDITIVEPYFSTRPNVWDLVIAMVAKATNESPNNQTSIRILYSSEKANLPSAAHLLQKFENEHRALYEDLTKLEFIALESKPNNEQIHNRYLITDLAACTLGFGFDARGQGTTDEVMLLGKEQYETRYAQYVSMEAFNPADIASKPDL
ncbi:hypothetical protein [Paraferrimonas haliotis]|uniref:hypothetical protein n=1 Tax=Paraferrimonas haliotis TaxID=2013866 RepID=UPI000BA9382D|nr:hypothetical protein [Paraferrimonas haliotis]